MSLLSVKFPVYSIPVSCSVPAKNEFSSSGEEKQNMSPGLLENDQYFVMTEGEDDPTT